MIGKVWTPTLDEMKAYKAREVELCADALRTHARADLYSKRTRTTATQVVRADVPFYGRRFFRDPRRFSSIDPKRAAASAEAVERFIKASQ